jgi:hypothetical protein
MHAPLLEKGSLEKILRVHRYPGDKIEIMGSAGPFRAVMFSNSGVDARAPCGACWLSLLWSIARASLPLRPLRLGHEGAAAGKLMKEQM